MTYSLGRAFTDVSLPLEMSLYTTKASSLYHEMREPITKQVDLRNVKDPLTKSEFSIWYLVVDLIELPRLALELRNQLHLLKKLRSKANFKEVADSYLAYQFGLKPTIADIRDLITIIRRWASHVSDAGGVIGGVYTSLEPIKAHREERTTHQFYFSDFDVNLTGQFTITSSIQLHATAKFYFVSPLLADLLSHFKKVVDQLGVLDPTVLWDVLPWSFVVDWVADVTGWIHRNLKPQLIPCDLVVCDWGESLHNVSTITGLLNFPGVLDLQDNAEVEVSLPLEGAVFSTARKRQFPRPLQVKREFDFFQKSSSIVTLRRCWLGAALVTQRRKVVPRFQPGNYRARGARSFKG
jgi:hypothetical protein